MLSDTVHTHTDQAHHVPSRSCMKSRQPVDECLVLATDTSILYLYPLSVLAASVLPWETLLLSAAPMTIVDLLRPAPIITQMITTGTRFNHLR